MREEYLESRLTGIKMKFAIKTDNVMSEILAKEPADDLTLEEAHELYERAIYFEKHRFDKPLSKKDLLPKR